MNVTRTVERRLVPADVHQRLMQCDLHPVLARVYAARDVERPEQLDTGLAALLPPASFHGLAAGVELLQQALQAHSRILVIGDFDADGATSCALMVRALRAFGSDSVDYLVPNRFEFGYGLTPEIVDVALERAPDLIVTVDNGTSSIAGVAHARANGVRVLVTDHHLPGESLPQADALVNPNLPGEPFASKALAGVGVAFYLLAALRARLRDSGWFEGAAPGLGEYLDLVALGTIADVVPLDHNNRILVEQGMRRIRSGHCCAGIRALMTCGGVNLRYASTMDLAFQVAPRLNAAGRLQDMSLGIACLLDDSPDSALRAAGELDQLNRQRREIEQDMSGAGIEQLDELRRAGELAAGLCFYDSDWHAGVVGIVAARLRELAARPVIVFADDDDECVRGSARSIRGLNVRDALERVDSARPGLLKRFGGHAAAAGVTLAKQGLDEFRGAFAGAVHDLLGGPPPVEKLLTDGSLDAGELNLAVAELLRSAAPWGRDFDEPLFDGEFDVLEARLVGDVHLKLKVRPVRSQLVVEAIVFRYGDQLPDARQVHLVYRLDVNEYNGRRRLQLVVEQLDMLTADHD